jgi:hypothetical protein
MKKGKIIWVLIIWFMWAVGMDIELLYRHQSTNDYFLSLLSQFLCLI